LIREAADDGCATPALAPLSTWWHRDLLRLARFYVTWLDPTGSGLLAASVGPIKAPISQNTGRMNPRRNIIQWPFLSEVIPSVTSSRT
jgi:hypothetical protein